jgi:hypothetical protein
MFYVSNDGLTALMYMNVLDSHLLLALPSMLVEALKESCVSAA